MSKNELANCSLGQAFDVPVTDEVKYVLLMSVTPSHIIEYLYCPRFTYYEYVLCILNMKNGTTKVERGRQVHDEKLERNKDYLRKNWCG